MTPDKAQKIIEASILSMDKENCDVEIAFFGGSFTAIEKSLQIELLKVANEYIQNKDVGGIRISTRPDYINREILDYLKVYGVTTIELGVQSMDDEVLLNSKRGHTRSHVIDAAKLIKEYGFCLVLQMMIGLPGDSLEKSLETAKQIISLCPNGIRIYPVVVLKDTELYRMYKDKEYKPLQVCEAIDWCSHIIPLFESEDIAILRIGLMSSDSLNEESVAGGAYHEALGELCYCKVFYNSAREQILKKDFEKNIKIFVPKGAVSKMAGHKKENIVKLKDEFLLKDIKIVETDELKLSNIKIEQS